MKKRLLTLQLVLLFVITGFAQNGILKTSKDKDSVVCFSVFDTMIKKIESSQSKETIKDIVKAEKDDDFLEQKSNPDELGYTHHYFQQTYKGINVENGMYIGHIKNGLLESVNGSFLKVGQVNINSKLSESEALTYALNAIGAQTYKWQIKDEEQFIKKLKNDENATFYPKGEKVIIYSDYYKLYRLAYKFNIYANYPLSRNNLFIDAITGEVLEKQNLIYDSNATGTGDTRYSGTQTITTDYSTTYRLRELTNSVRIETYNMRNQGGAYSTASDFTDQNNNWTAAEYHSNMDDAALDAHWGTEKVYAYWKNVRIVNSWNNLGAPLLSYVHADLPSINPYSFSNNDNAFWDGERMTYGDGTTKFYPLVSLDLIAHEIGHGFCTGVSKMRSPNLTVDILSVDREPKALNEGLSDIWGACVENWAAPTKQCWQNSEEIMKNGYSCNRSLRSPKTEGCRSGYTTEGNYPDTYGGNYWYSGTDNSQFSHYNATVLSHWFYMLSVGVTGKNDLGNSYSVKGIGIDDAASIVWRAERDKFISNTNFASARDLLIQAAAELFGANSCQVISVTNAWYAAGVGTQYLSSSVSYSPAIPNIICTSSFNVPISNIPANCTVSWYFSPNLTADPNNPNGFIVTSPGTGWVQATIVNSSNCTLGSLPKKNIWFGPPNNSNVTAQVIMGPSQNQLCLNSETYIAAGHSDISGQGVTSYEWIFGNWNPYLQGYENIGLIRSRALMVMTSSAPTSQTIYIKAANICQTSNTPFSKVFYTISCGGFLMVVSPNPATDNIELSFEPEDIATSTTGKLKIDPATNAVSDEVLGNYEVQLYSETSILKKSVKSDAMRLSIPVNDLPNGKYFIQLIRDGKAYQKTLIILR